jgi:hypothetical protein
MDLDGSKEVCGICKDWRGQREWIDGKACVKPSARGMCDRLKKIKPPHGGCDYWKKWKGEINDG